MKVQTLSVVCGTTGCDARCPFCISKMTGSTGIIRNTKLISRNFKKACEVAKDASVSTILLTGKGEPTLCPGDIEFYLRQLQPFNFPFIELQTNGLQLATNPRASEWLTRWWDMGVTMVCLSLVHYLPEPNRQIYTPGAISYYDISSLIAKIHSHGMSVRLCVMLLKDYINSMAEVERLVQFAKDNKVEQLTIRPADVPNRVKHPEVYKWTVKNTLSPTAWVRIQKSVHKGGVELLNLAHGARVYDYKGQNLCLSNCMTKSLNAGPDDIRQLIFFPDGHLRYDWQYEGAVLF